MSLKVQIANREKASPGFSVLLLVLSLLAGLAAVGIIFAVKGLNPLKAVLSIFASSFGSMFGLQETLTKAIPLVLIGSGLAVCFRAKFWNIGAESQLLFGAIFATWVALNLGPHLPKFLVLPLMLLAGFIGGGLWGMIPALFKARFGINEVISTLMLNYVAAEFVKFLVVGPWKGATKQGYPYTDDFPASATFNLLGYSRISPFMLIFAVARRPAARGRYLPDQIRVRSTGYRRKSGSRALRGDWVLTDLSFDDDDKRRHGGTCRSGGGRGNLPSPFLS